MPRGRTSIASHSTRSSKRFRRSVRDALRREPSSGCQPAAHALVGKGRTMMAASACGGRVASSLANSWSSILQVEATESPQEHLPEQGISLEVSVRLRLVQTRLETTWKNPVSEVRVVEGAAGDLRDGDLARLDGALMVNGDLENCKAGSMLSVERALDQRIRT